MGTRRKSFRNQPLVVQDVAQQIARGETAVIGMMVESNLKEGSQTMPPEGVAGLQRGVSATDACIGWDTTLQALKTLAGAVRGRRK